MKKLCFYTSITVLFTLLNSCRTDETSTAPETETLTSRQIFETSSKNEVSSSLYARDSTATETDSIDKTTELETDPVIPPKK